MQKFFAKAAQSFNRAAQFIADKLNDIRNFQPAKIAFKIAFKTALVLGVATVTGLFIVGLTAACIATKLTPEPGQNQQNQSTHEVLPPQEQINSLKYDLAECPAQVQEQEIQPADSEILAALTQALYSQEKQTWQSWIIKQLIFSSPTEATASNQVDAVLRTKPAISSEFAITLTCWEALISTTELLNAIKASEMKEIAADLAIPKYRNMNKTQLLIEIVAAHESAPAFSS